MEPAMNPLIQHCTMPAARWFAVALTAILMGCAGLPDQVVRVPSQAQPVVADSRLASLASASMTGEDRALSGLRLLPASWRGRPSSRWPTAQPPTRSCTRGLSPGTRTVRSSSRRASTACTSSMRLTRMRH